MKRATLLNFLLTGVILLFGVTACKKKPYGITPIKDQQNAFVPNPSNKGINDGGVFGQEPVQHVEGNPFPRGEDGSIPVVAHPDWENATKDRSKFAADTVYFAFDSAAVPSGEKSKLENVASYFKSSPAGDLLIEGHCDERGTEGYNLALGDKRANTLREYLVNLGVSPERIHTVSFGEAQPAVEGHNEAAWAKNRRGVFVFIEPAR